MIPFFQWAMKTLQSPVAIHFFLAVFWTNVHTCVNRLIKEMKGKYTLKILQGLRDYRPPEDSASHPGGIPHNVS